MHAWDCSGLLHFQELLSQGLHKSRQESRNSFIRQRWRKKRFSWNWDLWQQCTLTGSLFPCVVRLCVLQTQTTNKEIYSHVKILHTNQLCNASSWLLANCNVMEVTGKHGPGWLKALLLSIFKQIMSILFWYCGQSSGFFNPSKGTHIVQNHSVKISAWLYWHVDAFFFA